MSNQILVGWFAFSGVAMAALCAPETAHSQYPPGKEPPAVSVSNVKHFMATDAFWVRAPTLGDITRAYPAKAPDQTLIALVSINCTVGHKGILQDCSLGYDQRPGQGYGEAALGLASMFRSPIIDAEGDPYEGMKVQISILFRPRTAPTN